MATQTIHFRFLADGALVDPTSVKLSDATGTYGVKRNDTNAVVVADGTSMVKESTGTYTYTFTEPVTGLAYTAWIEAIYEGSTYRVERDIPAVSASTSIGVDRAELLAEVGQWLGYQRDSFTAKQQATLDGVLRSGLRQFYWPPPTLGSIAGHRWSFLKPLGTLTTVADQGEYTLPAGVSSIIGDLYYATADNVWENIRLTSIGELLTDRQRNVASGSPSIGAVVPIVSAGVATQQWKLYLSPIPDAVYTLTYPYQITPDALDASHTFPIGDPMHGETLLASCLAVAERLIDDGGNGVQQAYWQERLAASVAHDRRNAPRIFGYYGDTAGRGPASVPPRTTCVTYNGALYE